MAAPCTVIVGYDTNFHEHLPELFPHNLTARSWFEGNEAFSQEAAMRNSSLQGAYFMIAARSLGVDCGPMSGFDKDKVNAEFFTDGQVKSNFLINLGYGDDQKLFAAQPAACPSSAPARCCDHDRQKSRAAGQSGESKKAPAKKSAKKPRQEGRTGMSDAAVKAKTGKTLGAMVRCARRSWRESHGAPRDHRLAFEGAEAA